MWCWQELLTGAALGAVIAFPSGAAWIAWRFLALTAAMDSIDMATTIRVLRDRIDHQGGFVGLLPLAVAVGTCLVLVGGYGAYRKGRADVEALWQAERRSYELAAAQAAAARRERERQWQDALTVAGAKYDERAKMADRSFDSSLDRLRSAYASGARVRATAEPAGTCPVAGGPAAADVLRAGEELAAILRDADRDRAALMACVGAWPR